MVDEAERYAPTARVLHWLVAILLLTVLPLGAVIKFVRDDIKPAFYMWHESLGFIILWLMLARLAVRLVRRPPPEDWLSPRERRISATVHGLLYAALILMPITGFLATNAHGFPLEWFWLVPVWSPIDRAPEIAPYFSAAHAVLAWAIVVLFLLHMAGVLYHHIIKRDRTLYRML